MIFDLLWLDGHSLMGLPYYERRDRLLALQLSGASWQTPEYLLGDGSEVLKASAAQDLEGIVAKRLDSTYEPGRRSTTWVKIKNVSRQELVIGGWLPGKGGRSAAHRRAARRRLRRGRLLRYAGRVGTGFTERPRPPRRPAGRNRAPAIAVLRPARAPPRGAVFCEPRLVAEIEFTEWTARGSLRHPSYKGLREDKAPEQVVREDQSGPAPEGRGPGPRGQRGRGKDGFTVARPEWGRCHTSRSTAAR